MQLNVHVPKDKTYVVRALDETATRLGRKKNELVLEALEAYLSENRPSLGTFDLGAEVPHHRDELYLERWAE